MIVGIPKEIKNNENRVGMTPAGVSELIRHGHTVYVQHTAGEGSGFPDSEYQAVGATILPDIADVYAAADMIVKVKEPIEPEYPLIKEAQLIFTYFHFASDRRLTEAMVASRAVCLAYETVELTDHSLPLLIPMSEVAGRMSIQEGARFLEKPQSGKGILLGGVPGVKPAKVLILGAGTVGTNAALMAAGLGADVTITDINLRRLRQLDETMPRNVKTLYSSRHNIEKELPTVDLVVGSVLIPRLFRDLAPHFPFRTSLHRRWHSALCRGQYPRSRALHLDTRTDQRHHALRHSTCRQRLAASVPRRPRSCTRPQHRERGNNLQGSGRRVANALHPINPVTA